MPKYDIVRVALHTPDLHSSLRIAVGHVRVIPKDIESSFLGRPRVTRERLKLQNELLNALVRCGSKLKKHVDLLVLPELSVPCAWRPMLVSWSRSHQIGVVCGLEHRIGQGNCVLNEILTILPYKTKDGEHACLPIRRLKRLYSPEEIFMLTNNHKKVPENCRRLYKQPKYHLFQWRGASFAVYNCYELASIEDRAIFKGKVDFIVCSEFNRDVGYFSNIVESAARDLHCYVVQVNDSHYGDSRIVSPSQTINMNPLRIKGGDNCTYLTMELALAELREHQSKGYGLQRGPDSSFKPTPPRFRNSDVEDRMRLGSRS